ncbi:MULTISPECIES: DUF3800 domain-containing protein [Achromobacter]|uniref:DUF3800 domain-containing protein n=1 Tax=Achromobacter TaxID=222 RepID=UPI001EEE316D|nr:MULTISPECIES: DUF3800 domain-containing protein [Achromobacter]
MSRELVLYCDESDISGKHFANFYGGVLVESAHLSEVVSTLQAAKDRLNLGAEVKWQKITEAYAGKYIALMDETFALMRAGKLKMRIMFTQNYFGAKKLTPAQRENSFFLLYYQFVKHAFGFRYCGGALGSARVRIYFDKLPDTDEKCLAFKGYVLGLNSSREFRAAGLSIAEDQMAEVDSKEHVLLQCLDVVLGAMQFRLNEKHKEKPEGARVRGKRTRAKEAVYKHINGQIREIYPNFNIGISTGGDPEMRWQHPYRHWLFKPTEFEIRPQFAKRK